MCCLAKTGCLPVLRSACMLLNFWCYNSTMLDSHTDGSNNQKCCFHVLIKRLAYLQDARLDPRLVSHNMGQALMTGK